MERAPTNAIDFMSETGRVAHAGSGFADPEWRGDQRDFTRDPATIAGLATHVERLADWIRGGACYGWLDCYQARRAAFELQSIRVQLKGLAADEPRCAIRSRLDRLEALLRLARGAAWSGSDEPPW
jgi:hypothetical protein